MPSAKSVVRRISVGGLILGIALAVVALPGCSTLGKRGSSPAARARSAGQSSAKKYKDPVNEFLATTSRVPLDGGK